LDKPGFFDVEASSMFHRPYPSAWRIGAELIAKNVLQPLRRRLTVRANFWARRDVFYKSASPEPSVSSFGIVEPMQTTACADSVCGMIWGAQMRQLLWLETDLPKAAMPDATLHYAELRPEYILYDLTEMPIVQVAFIASICGRLGPLRVSSVVDKVLSKEPWFCGAPFACTYLLACAPSRKTRLHLPTETAIPAPVSPKVDVLAHGLTEPVNRKQSHSASILNDLPLRSLRASTANSRSKPHRHARRHDRAGQRS
jgi:hypothetical protein